MIKYVVDGISMLVFIGLFYTLLIVGDVWENKIRCERGYQPACQALRLDR